MSSDIRLLIIKIDAMKRIASCLPPTARVTQFCFWIWYLKEISRLATVKVPFWLQKTRIHFFASCQTEYTTDLYLKFKCYKSIQKSVIGCRRRIVGSGRLGESCDYQIRFIFVYQI
ncbi:Hypothetical_protein [Hexamita inflata]|uniref:Hypothetical_protein n=1 Tax=Hexamita inflata TaxID=28002 RepID=A0ABP1KHN2_9EUKA